MRGAKIVVVGAGSLFFTRQMFVGMCSSKAFAGSTFTLVDIDEDIARTMAALGQKTVAHTQADLHIDWTTDRLSAFEGADFIILSFASKNAHYRGVDTRLPRKFGIRMCSGDTTGPGGIMRTCREAPKLVAMAHEIEGIAPEAWVINYVNPTATMGMALAGHADLKHWFALCDAQKMPDFKERIIRRCGLVGEDEPVPTELYNSVAMKVAGINHFTWMTELKQDGKDLLPRLHEWLVKMARESEMQRAALELWDGIGYYPTIIGHTAEYVPYFQDRGRNTDDVVIHLFDAEKRKRWIADHWTDIRAYVSGEKPIAEFVEKTRSDMVVDIIEGIMTDSGFEGFANVLNRGTVTNLPDDAFLELLCRFSSKGPEALPFGKFPRGLVSKTMQVYESHALAVEAALSCDHKTLLQAFLADPIVLSINDARKLIAELLEAERKDLPNEWFA